MTSRASAGPGPREPLQRSFSATSSFSRPSPHRTLSLSQQFSSSSPTRRSNDVLSDSSQEQDVGGRHAPRIGASRLRLEVSTTSTSSALGSPTPVLNGRSTSKPYPPLPLPPRGRPVLHSDVPSISNLSPRPSEGESQDEPVILPMPLPTRPGQHAPPASSSIRQPAFLPHKKDARPKPYNLEVPITAPHYPSNGHADFFPWVGNHAEDQFSEPVIRHGYLDKAQITPNEGGSAKQSIFPALKHKSGLQTLSSLFTNVLAQRRAHGQISTASTFKPPPRVTVTDTKREMWLKDLANPTISLRRLSRSIPHGIRGKVLLEQSLSKRIPIERAVWLAKCVGANELRSFRRKGVSGTFAMGGEAKWIRDFTVCVEQFVESISGTCGEKDFRARIDYAIRLATYFHAEHLLDRDHYMDWLVTSLENSPQARLPIWLLITEIYWKDMLQYRKYGRRLTMSLVGHLAQSTSHADHDILAPLCNRLVHLLNGLMISNPESFVSPTMWLKYRDVLSSSLSLENDGLPPAFVAIDRRNTRIALPKTERELNTRRRFIQMLDATISKPFDPAMSQLWWDLDDDKHMLVQTILTWATSYHRSGYTRIYVATRVLRLWSNLGADLTGSVLTYMNSDRGSLAHSSTTFYHLTSELARSEHFSAPRYIRWLVARGGLNEAAEVVPDAPYTTRLLAELPLHNLSENILDLRTTLLNRAGFSTEDEAAERRKCMAIITSDLPHIQSHTDFGLEGIVKSQSPDLITAFASMSRTSKSETGLWLRQRVRAQMTQPMIPPLDNWDNSPTKGGMSGINALDFDNVRKYFERLEDFSMLADTMISVIRSDDAEVLAACADTLNLHLETFAAIGALSSLFDILMSRMRSLCEDTDAVPRIFLVSAADLASRIPQQETTARSLAQELLRSDRKTAADACSPVSDHMAAVETVEADFTDEIEKSLVSGNSMDHGTLERMFQRIILHLEVSWEKVPEQQRSCGLLLTRLRTFDSKHFDALMKDWIGRLLRRRLYASLGNLLGPLISLGSIHIRDVMVIYNCLATSSNDPSIALEVLGLMTGVYNVSQTLTRHDIYRLRMKRAQMQSEHQEEVLLVIRNTLESCASVDEKDKQLLSRFEVAFNTPSVLQLLQRLALHSIEGLTQNLILPLISNAKFMPRKIMTDLIDNLLVARSRASPISIEMLLSSANDLSLPFCQIKLASMLREEHSAVPDGALPRSDQLDAFDAAIKAAVCNGNTSWASIIPMLDTSIAAHLRQQAEQQFLSLFPSPKTMNSEASPDCGEQVKQANHVLRIINTTICSTPTATVSAHPPLGPDIVATCNGLWVLLSNAPSMKIISCIVTDWLPLLLSFMTMRTPTFDTTKLGHESRAKMVLSLVAIYLQLRVLEMDTGIAGMLMEQTFDLALCLVDALPDETRQQCIRSLRETVCSPPISYILSHCPNPTEWLVLVQKERLPADKVKPSPFSLRRWEMLGEPTPNVGENDTSLSLTLFGARRS